MRTQFLKIANWLLVAGSFLVLVAMVILLSVYIIEGSANELSKTAFRLIIAAGSIGVIGAFLSFIAITHKQIFDSF